MQADFDTVLQLYAPFLLQVFLLHLKDFRNMTVSPEQIIIGAGTEYLYGLLIQLLGFDKHYAVEVPGYSKISQIYKSHCVLCDFVSMDSSGVSISDLEKQNIEKAILMIYRALF